MSRTVRRVPTPPDGTRLLDPIHAESGHHPFVAPLVTGCPERIQRAQSTRIHPLQKLADRAESDMSMRQDLPARTCTVSPR